MTSSKEPHRQRVEVPLRGVDKATALLLTMSKASADRIIKQFEDRDIRAVAQSAMELASVDLPTLAHIIEELGTSMEIADPLVGSPKGAKDLLSGVVSDDAVDAFLDTASSDPSRLIWDALDGVDATRLVAFVAAEHPQIGACLLSKLQPAKASSVLEALDPELQSELSLRLLALEPIGDPALRLLESWISVEFSSQSPQVDAVGNHARLAAILNQLQRDQSSAILDRLDAAQPEDARQVRQFVFSFEDIVGLSIESRTALFDQIPSERTILALRECEPALCVAVLAALSPRSRRVVEAELSSPSSAPIATVIEARRAIADHALGLAAKSLIRLNAAIG